MSLRAPGGDHVVVASSSSTSGGAKRRRGIGVEALMKVVEVVEKPSSGVVPAMYAPRV